MSNPQQAVARVLLVLALAAGFAGGGCATLGSLGPKYEADEVDALNGKTKQIAAKLVRTADGVKRIQEALVSLVGAEAGSIDKAKATAGELKDLLAELQQLPDDVKQIISSAESLLRSAPKNYAGPRALHLPKKKELLEEAVDIVKGMPQQIQEIGLAAQELAKCAATLVSGGQCDKVALANAKVSVPPALRAIAAKAPPPSAGSATTTASRATAPQATGTGSGSVTFTCPQPQAVAEKLYAALGQQCQSLLAERQLRSDLERGAGLCETAPLEPFKRFVFAWTPADDPQMVACVARGGEYWSKLESQTQRLYGDCNPTTLLAEITQQVSQRTRQSCEAVSKRLALEFATFRAPSRVATAKWGSTPKEVLATGPDPRPLGSGDLVIERPVGGFNGRLVYRFEQDRLTRIDVAFKPDPAEPWPMPRTRRGPKRFEGQASPRS